ncbi:hypothetical protein A2995_01200 [Candidatus Nomurabacteria bacterium RIFCSPLOWO2_01_FULL_33_24]|uniref:PrgI family protein n=1 Tax=Candidatus Nomurabacteria bacterium RIFCSPLOWO2_01_FULL_33_24 TaxID=1801765 RepID=A0A1F6WZE5_9BACT|nr:MAG: hypothetical protein A2995_01200 [Candidatus Nomurabacteria bacterium RIFCSPLOWO2_01_FULL_33_24]
MRFRVPQFIDIEDKVFGPFSFKQFVYLAGGGGLSYVIFKILPLFIAIFLILPVIALSLALTFYKVNNKPFIAVLESYFKYLIQGKLYIWRKERKITKKKEVDKISKETSQVPGLSGSKLKEISWSLDVLDINEDNNQ